MGANNQTTVLDRKKREEADQIAYAEAVNRRLADARDGGFHPIDWLDEKRTDFLGVRPAEAAQAGGGMAYFSNPVTDARQRVVERLMKQAADKNSVLPTYSYGMK